MTRLRPTLALPALLLLAAPVLAQVDQDEYGSCCSQAAAEGGVCNHAAPAELRKLPDDADAKARRLQDVHRRAVTSLHPYLGLGGLEQLRADLAGLADLEPEPDARTVQGAHWVLAHYAMGAGDIEGAIEHFEIVARMFRADPSLTKEVVAEALYRLGLAYFRLAERQNCIAHHNTDSCIFPLSRAAVHLDTKGASQALATFQEALELFPEHREARWLLNIAYMALGKYPDETPPEIAYPPERFVSSYDIGRFYDVAPKLGLNRLTRAGGMLLEDFDGDGWLDVMSSSMDTSQPVRLHRNQGDGTFVDVTVAAGLQDQLGGINLVHGDLDGDGLLDVLVLRGGELGTEGEIPNSLLHQVKPGVFEDVTALAGIELAAPTQTAALADVDGDGDLDLFIGYESRTGGTKLPLEYPSKLYRNDGKLRFVDVTEAAGIANGRMCVGAVFGDYDDDGDPDLYLSNLAGANRLYRNDGGWKFTDVAEGLRVTGPRDSYATWFFDYDNDGDLDLFVGYRGYVYPERAVARYYLDGTVEGESITLYENQGEGRFADVTEARGLRRAVYPLGGNFGDVDGDGWPDIYLGTGSADMGALWPNVMLRNDAARGFQDVTWSGGLGHLQKGNSVAFGDVDGDGDQDIMVQVGGYHLDDGFWDVLFENPGHGHRWLTVRLQGVRSNRFGVGARVRVRIVEGEAERDVYGFVGGNSSFGGNSLQQELGLGDADRIAWLEVRWPAGGVQRFESVPLDRVVVAREGEEALEELPARSVRLAPPAPELLERAPGPPDKGASK